MSDKPIAKIVHTVFAIDKTRSSWKSNGKRLEGAGSGHTRSSVIYQCNSDLTWHWWVALRFYRPKECIERLARHSKKKEREK